MTFLAILGTITVLSSFKIILVGKAERERELSELLRLEFWEEISVSLSYLPDTQDKTTATTNE